MMAPHDTILQCIWWTVVTFAELQDQIGLEDFRLAPQAGNPTASIEGAEPGTEKLTFAFEGSLSYACQDIPPAIMVSHCTASIPSAGLRNPQVSGGASRRAAKILARARSSDVEATRRASLLGLGTLGLILSTGERQQSFSAI